MEREMCLELEENDDENEYERQEFEHIEHFDNIVTSFIRISKGQFPDQYNAIKEIVHDEETDRIKIGSGDLAVSPEHSVHVSYSRDNLEDRGNTLNPSSLRMIRLPSNSSGFVSLSNLEKAFFEDSILRCGILNQTMANISSLENLRKSSLLVTNTLDSDLENLANLPFDSPFGFDIVLTPCSLRNFSNLSSTFSSERNLINWDVDDNIFFASCNICRVLESCHDMFFSQGGECFKDFFKGRSIFEHLKNLPNHNPGAFESRLAMTNLTVRNDILVDFNSHNINNTKELYKYFGNLYIRDRMIKKIYLRLGEKNEGNERRGWENEA